MTSKQVGGVAQVFFAALVIAYLISGVAHCQSWHFGTSVAAQVSASRPSAGARADRAGAPGGNEAPARAASPGPLSRLVVSVSRQSSAVLRAFAGGLPEATALYSVRVCSRATGRTEADPGLIETAIVEAGIAVTPRSLAQLAVHRERSRALSVLAKLGETAAVAAPVVVGFAASGTLALKAWQVAAISGFGSGLKLIGDATTSDRERAGEPIAAAGAWLSEMPVMVLEPGHCSPPMLMLGSFDPKRRAEVLYIE